MTSVSQVVSKTYQIMMKGQSNLSEKHSEQSVQEESRVGRKKVLTEEWTD